MEAKLKLKHITKLNILLMAYAVAMPSFAADLNLDFIRRQAFENNLYNAPEVRTVSLFHKKKAEKKPKVTVERDEALNVVNQNTLTDEEYIKKLKVANKKKIRKKQFDITIQREAASAAEEETLPEEKNIVVEETTTEEDDSALTTDPSDKKFFNKKENKKKLFGKKKQEKNKNQKTDKADPSNLILTADVTDYFPERSEIEAKGNAKLEITGQDFVLYGDKIVFNHDINTVRAYNNVKIIQGENTTTGDFVNVDLSTSNGWIRKPVSTNYSVKIKAEEAYVYPDKIEEYDGVANILEDRRFEVGSSGFTTLLNAIPSNVQDSYLQKPEPTPLKFKVKEINVEPKDGHNVITMKNVGVFFKKIKVGVMPNVKLVSDKEQTIMQTNIPEIGSDSNLGMYAGPGFVFNLPMSSTLKVAPLLVYSQDEKKLGIGANATFQSQSNVTQMAYGSPENKFMLRGFQAITPKLKLNYSQNMYVSQWFLGYRRPMYSAELEYSDSMYVQDLGLNFEHNLSGGYYSDYARISKLAEGRLRWMTQVSKNLFTYTNSANTFSLDFGLVGQGAVSQYTTGDTLGIVRGGPMLTTTYRGWSQNLVYYQSAASGRTPFIFDDYYYGRSNLQILETLRINKYLKVGYLASMALGGRETYNSGRYNPTTQDFLQENMFLLSIGPDEAKITFAYDAFRKTTAMYFSMLLGTKDMDIAFKKSTINNPDELSGENQNIPWIKNTFNNIRFKVFPLTNPAFNPKTDLYPQEVIEEDKDELDEMMEEEVDREFQQQIRNQFNPILQNQDLMRDNRM